MTFYQPTILPRVRVQLAEARLPPVLNAEIKAYLKRLGETPIEFSERASPPHAAVGSQSWLPWQDEAGRTYRLLFLWFWGEHEEAVVYHVSIIERPAE